MISARNVYEKLSVFGAMPAGPAGQTWLRNAEQETLELLRTESDFVILYAMFRHLWIVSVFASAAKMKKPNKHKLYDARIEIGSAWCMQQVWGGAEAH